MSSKGCYYFKVNDHICTQRPQLNGPITLRALELIVSEGIWMAYPFSSVALLEEGSVGMTEFLTAQRLESSSVV